MSLRSHLLCLLLFPAGVLHAQPLAFDAVGDPLPPGAIARIGSIRFQHGNSINTLAYSPDGAVLASAGDGGTISIWEANSGRLRRRISEPTPDIAHLAISESGAIASLDKSGQLSVFSLTTGKLLHRTPCDKSTPPAFSADGKSLLVCDPEQKLHLLDALTGKERSTFTPRQPPKWVALSPDGKLAALASSEIIRLFDTATGKRLRTFEGHDKDVSFVAFTPDGKGLLSGDELGVVALWKIDNEDAIAIIESQKKEIRDVRWTEGGRVLVIVDAIGAVTRCDREGKKLDGVGLQANGDDHPVLSPDGKRLAAASGGSVRVRDVATDRLTPDLGQAISFVGAGRAARAPLIALAGSEGTLTLWEPGNVRPRHFPTPDDGSYAPVISPDGKLLVSGSDKSVFRIWDARKGTEIVVGHVKSELARPAAFHPDGELLAIECDKTFAIVDVRTGKERLVIDDPNEGRGQPQFTPDGRTFVVSSEKGIRFWEMTTGRERRHLQVNTQVNSMAIAPDGGSIFVGDRSGGLRRIPLGAGPAQRFGGHDDTITALAISPDGKVLASAADDMTVRLWDVASGREITQLTGHQRGVTGLVFSHDGKHLVTAGSDATALIWDVAAVLARPQVAPEMARESRSIKELWSDLGDREPVRAYDAVRALIDRPAESLPLLGQLRPVPTPESKTLTGLLVDLDSDTFEVRERAMQKLREQDLLAEPILRKALEAKPTAEARRAIEEVLGHLREPLAEGPVLRDLRAIEVLEQIDTPETRAILEKLATGAAGARVTIEAKKSLDRLARLGR